MTGKRKLSIAILTIIAFTVILIIKDYDPLALGGGFTTILFTIMYGYSSEYKYKGKG